MTLTSINRSKRGNSRLKHCKILLPIGRVAKHTSHHSQHIRVVGYTYKQHSNKKLQVTIN